MRLAAECPRCPHELAAVPESPAHTGRCATHGTVAPLWRAGSGEYDALIDHLALAAPLPTWLPWPLPHTWQLTDFGCVVESGTPRATFATCAGLSAADGVVELTIVTEEPGTGLGARCAGVPSTAPSPDTLAGPPVARVRMDGDGAALWQVSTSDSSGELEHAVLVGEARGRWLWLVLRPASATLLVPEIAVMQDVAALGPQLLEMPFGELPRSW